VVYTRRNERATSYEELQSISYGVGPFEQNAKEYSLYKRRLEEKKWTKK